MKIEKAIEILELHNKWRRDNEGYNMAKPKELGIAIDTVVSEFKNLHFKNVSGSASFDTVKRIWNAAKNYTMHELGEICKGDAAYCEDVPDLETYFERHYR